MNLNSFYLVEISADKKVWNICVKKKEETFLIKMWRGGGMLCFFACLSVAAAGTYSGYDLITSETNNCKF